MKNIATDPSERKNHIRDLMFTAKHTPFLSCNKYSFLCLGNLKSYYFPVNLYPRIKKVMPTMYDNNFSDNATFVAMGFFSEKSLYGISDCF